MIHDKTLGQMIDDRLKVIGMTKAEFGRRINTSRQNVSLILRKESMDTKLLQKISVVLDHDFFSDLSRTSGAGSQRIDFTLSEVRVIGIVKIDQ
jgi:transcriptional regulator with XRE-family HTH domain